MSARQDRNALRDRTRQAKFAAEAREIIVQERVNYAHGTGVRHIAWKYRQQVADMAKQRRNGKPYVTGAYLDRRLGTYGPVWDSKESAYEPIDSRPLKELWHLYDGEVLTR
jgi:hypothetical protein